jgi:hypothetical protein
MQSSDGGDMSTMTDDRQEHMRTALILSQTARMLDEALHGRARFEVREEAYDALAVARRRVRDCDALLFSEKESR